MPANIQPRPTVATFTLSSHGTGVAQTVQVGSSAHEFRVDAAPAFGGNDAAPSPIAYALGALISCSQVTGQIAAKALGLTVDRFEFELSADLDTAILAAGAVEGNANFESVTIIARLTTRASDTELRALKAETERRCPIFQLYVRSGVAVSSLWIRAEA